MLPATLQPSRASLSFGAMRFANTLRLTHLRKGAFDFGSRFISKAATPGRSLYAQGQELQPIPGRRSASSLQQCRASEKDSRSSSSEESKAAALEADNNNGLLAVGLGALWLALLGYAFLLSPNQTPFRDVVFLKLLVGLGQETEGFQVNPVFVALFNIMGVYPMIYSGLLVPSARSESKLPAWPFVAVSFAVGIFALLPYMALWKPQKSGAQQLPPPREELEGWRNVVMKGTEGRILPVLLLVGAVGLTGYAATAGGAAWADYARLFDESRFVHVTSIDFLLLTAFAPFWMLNDAQARKWEGRNRWLPILSFLPVVGPALYLVLRPKTADLQD